MGRPLMRLALALVLLAACSKEPKAQQTPANQAPASIAPRDPSIDAAPYDPCVTDCVARNQMRATSPEQIEAECRQQCVGPGH